MASEEKVHGIEPDPRECSFELPPIEGGPFVDHAAKMLAIRRMIEQAIRERATDR